MPHQKSTPNFIDASDKKVLQIILIIGRSPLYWKKKDLSNQGEGKEILTMRQKKAVTGELRDRYQKVRKNGKIVILDELTHLTDLQPF